MTTGPQKPRPSRQDLEHRFNEVSRELEALKDTDSAGAVEAARSLKPDGILDQDNTDALAAVTLIDAGSESRDKAAVDQGVDLLERLNERLPDRAHYEYCLANGLIAQAGLNAAGKARTDWYLTMALPRQRARHLLQTAGSRSKPSNNIRARSYTNLANSLYRVYRMIEACDWHTRALGLDHTNGIAQTGAAKALIWLANHGMGDREALLSMAAAHLTAARERPDRIRELAGERAYQELSKLLETKLPEIETPDLTEATPYQRFIIENRLALSFGAVNLDRGIDRWDSLEIKSVTVPVDSTTLVPPIFAMFNTMKADYICARQLAFSAVEEPFPESATYADSLDYARYGVSPSMMTIAQKACLDLLDKVAVATTEYLDLPGRRNDVYFSNRWFKKTKSASDPLEWQPEISSAIESGVTALMALADVSLDVRSGGFLRQKQMMRHSSTHRFIVLHDLGMPEADGSAIDHFELDLFRRQLIETLQLSRAVLFYFVEMIMQAEHRHHDDGKPRINLSVPDHRWVRGEREN
jgi:hypothetical protein